MDDIDSLAKYIASLPRPTTPLRALFKGPIFVRVLVAPNFLESSEADSLEKPGENATATKHGFESRWGHQDR
jgi:hypothetical protein